MDGRQWKWREVAIGLLQLDEKHGGEIGLNERPVSPSGYSIRSQSRRRLLSSHDYICSYIYFPRRG
jgi:hypothetical protein